MAVLDEGRVAAVGPVLVGGGGQAMTRFRRLRWVGGGAVAAVVAISAVGAMAASAGGRAGQRSASRGCYPEGSRTIAQDKAGRFYSTMSGTGRSARTYWYVCAFRQGTSWKLGYTGAPTRGPGFPIPWDSSARVSGRYVAFFVFQPGGPFGQVEVIDMVTGRPTFSSHVNTDFGHTNQLVLKANGSVGWMGYVSSQTGTSWEVDRHDSTGTATLDSGSEIEPKSLAAGGPWLYWTNGGSPRSAPFH